LERFDRINERQKRTSQFHIADSFDGKVSQRCGEVTLV
jgi:hypothetical protein